MHEQPGLRRITTPEEGVYVVPSHDDKEAHKNEVIKEIVFEDGEEVGLVAALKGEPPKTSAKATKGKKAEVQQATAPVQPLAPTEPQSPGFLVSVQSDLGVLEAEAVDIIDSEKLFGICYNANKRGNKIIPKPSAGKMDITVIDRATDSEAIYAVAPLGVVFTIPKSNLLVVLFEQVE